MQNFWWLRKERAAPDFFVTSTGESRKSNFEAILDEPKAGVDLYNIAQYSTTNPGN